MSDTPSIQLVVGGKTLEKTWTEVVVTRSMESMCSSFQFVCTQDSPNFKFREWPIKMGAPCEVRVDGPAALKGFIDDINVSYDDKTHEVQVAGRDVTCDLVDCQKADGPFEFGTVNKITVKRIIESICSPFSIPVVIDPTAADAVAQLKSTFYIQPGDPLMGSLLRISRWARTFLLASTQGELIVTMAGTRRADVGIQAGINVKRGSIKQSDKERFSVYYVKGYGTSTDNLARSQDWLWMNGRFPSSNPPSYPDARTGATRYRPFASMAETAVQIDNVGWRAKAEAQYRIGNSRKYEYVVQGWREKPGGNLWEPNTIVPVTDERFGLSSTDMLVEAVKYSQSGDGSLTTLTLCSKEKYTAQAELNRIKTVFEDGVK